MISKLQLKKYSSLKKKKFRNKERMFIVEGLKIVLEGLNSHYSSDLILMSFEFAEKNIEIVQQLQDRKINLEFVSNYQINKLSDTENPQGIIGIFSFNKINFDINVEHSDVLVYIDNISDPGNLGTIIRNCDWFGISEILISPDSTEYLNPKVIRSSMGSIFHLNIYDDVNIEVLREIKNLSYKLICSDIEGENIYNYSFPDKYIITLSSESKGPSDSLKKLQDVYITIPRYGKAESLNVGVASGIIFSRLDLKSKFIYKKSLLKKI